MIDVIGLICIDETKKERIDYLIASIRSYAFLKDCCKFILCMENCSEQLYGKVNDELKTIGFDFKLIKGDSGKSYGQQYVELLQHGKNDFVINFMEDQFMVCNNVEQLKQLLNEMRGHTDICKCSFYSIEQNSSGSIVPIKTTGAGKFFVNHDLNFARYKAYYGNRYYIGVNFLTSTKFAMKFWSRDCGKRPHEYEIQGFDEAWLHQCVIPGFELQAAIDDDHGDENSCLIRRKEKKFNHIMATLPSPYKNHQTSSLPFENSSLSNEQYVTGKITVTESALHFLKYMFSPITEDNFGKQALFINAGDNLLFYTLLPITPSILLIESESKTFFSIMDKIRKLPDYSSMDIIPILTPSHTNAVQSLSDDLFDFIHLEMPDADILPLLSSKLVRGGVLMINSAELPYDEEIFTGWGKIETYNFKDGTTDIDNKTIFYIKPVTHENNVRNNSLQRAILPSPSA